MHRHGVQVRPSQAAHSVSFVSVTRVSLCHIGVLDVFHSMTLDNIYSKQCYVHAHMCTLLHPKCVNIAYILR